MTDRAEISLPSSPSRNREEELDQACARVLESPDGQLVMGWLKSFTTNIALGPDAPDAKLRHTEGGRFVVAAWETRALKARSVKNEPVQPRRRRDRGQRND
jgi:hypothetical protein